MMFSNLVFVMDTPDTYRSEKMEKYIQEQRHRNDRQWVANVIQGLQETEHVKIRNSDFVLLPDLAPEPTKRVTYTTYNSQRRELPPQLNWLVLFTSPNLRTIRDLRGEHIELLESVKEQCMTAVQKEYGILRRDVMIFANYPPSVFSLHFHVCCPFKAAAPFDAFRMHTLESIIHHLKVDSEYYNKYSLHIPVTYCSRLYNAIVGDTEKQDMKHITLKKYLGVWKRVVSDVK